MFLTNVGAVIAVAGSLVFLGAVFLMRALAQKNRHARGNIVSTNWIRVRSREGKMQRVA